MVAVQHECALVRVLVTSHAYGSPLPTDIVLKRAAIPADELGDAKVALDRIQTHPFVENHGSRGIKLDSGHFQSLVQWLYDQCDWERFELELRLKHFEGWDQVEW
jgi:hypothetical protein